MKHFNPSTAVAHPVGEPVRIDIVGAVGDRFRCDDRNVVLEAIRDDGTVALRDVQTEGLLQVRDPATDAVSDPTVEWMREMYARGLLHPVGDATDVAVAQGRFLLLDPHACASRDAKSRWRDSLAWRACMAQIDRTDRAIRHWLDGNFGTEPSDLRYPRPGASSVRRWMRRVEKLRRPGALVSSAGRRLGQAQVSPFVDRLLHEAALWFWARPRATKAQAYAWLEHQLKRANEQLAPSAPKHRCPSKEALRKRIERLRCAETVAAKEGRQSSEKLYKGSGEPVLVDRLLELVLMDAADLEQVIVFDDAWQLPACKVRITVLMDYASHAILGWCVYAGPPRAETSMQAVIDCLAPSEYPEAVLAQFPDLRWIFGKPSTITPDNAKPLVGPSSLPGLNSAGIGLAEPPVGMPTAKAALERFFRSLKEELAMLPGTIIDPKRARDLDYDGVAAAMLTLPQLRVMVAHVVASHNVSPSKGLDGRSPLQVWMQKARNRATPVFVDRDHVARCLSREYQALLTGDGIELDGIRYRDPRKVRLGLDHMHHTQARRSQRKDGSATVKVTVRRNDGNIDSIEFLDTLDNSWISLPSTQPAYTHNLTAWEHDKFREMARKRNEPFDTEQARQRSKALTLGAMEEMLPKMKFKERATMAALHQSHVVDALKGGRKPALLPDDAVVSPQLTADDLGIAPTSPGDSKSPTARSSGRKPKKPAIDRAEAFWDAVRAGAPAEAIDPETGIEPEPLHGEDPYDGDVADEETGA
ncbi:integrase [Sphingomonas oryzagri]|uniref:Integrase n=1 Tax=Sphingomonas oryzagri TaxID=3042314 RepID=A0ABT6N467_9SPHN|nr:integrase [Sphingomonas oryzagri]MDH7639957.1 integrase [Sphingomonas oryzagri]